MKRVLFLILTLFLFAGIGYAQDMSKSVLIPDARYESVKWWADSVYCVDRSVVAGGELSAVWSGNLTFLYIEKKVITPYVVSEKIVNERACKEDELICYDSAKNNSIRQCTKKELEEGDCYDIIYQNVTYQRITWVPFNSKKFGKTELFM